MSRATKSARLSSIGAWNRGEVYADGRHLGTYINGTTYLIYSDHLGTERIRTNCTRLANMPRSLELLPFRFQVPFRWEIGVLERTEPNGCDTKSWCSRRRNSFASDAAKILFQHAQMRVSQKLTDLNLELSPTESRALRGALGEVCFGFEVPDFERVHWLHAALRSTTL
jgi:hypothetical protein